MKLTLTEPFLLLLPSESLSLDYLRIMTGSWP